MFAVVVTGPPGSGKSVTLEALGGALVDDEVAHAAVDVDELARAYPYPTLEQRCEHLRAWRAAQRHPLLLVAEVIESPAHLRDVLAALGADDHLLVRLDAPGDTLRRRIIAREPPGWSGLQRLLDETPRLQASLARLDGVHTTVDSERCSPRETAEQIRSARPDKLAA